MSMEFWFRGRLEYESQTAIDALAEALVEEGCVGHPDNLVTDDDLRWSGQTLTIESRGSMPYSCFDVSSFVLSLYAQHANRGEVIVLNVEDGLGERCLAGGAAEELDEAEVERLRVEYGWGKTGDR
jgi:hypothetical protein